tara:strand:- start:286 stop:414 length:129 start_codon:yes stop_codon:yes gene_type:complete
MIKKITLFLLLLCFVVSCGKKGDPKYKESKKIEIKSIIIKIV